jgi:hypothetical protein
MASKCRKVRQRKLKTIRDLKHYLKINGLARHVIHDGETDCWWFADNRNRLLEKIFNAGSPLVFAAQPRSAQKAEKYHATQKDLEKYIKGFRLKCPFLSPKMTNSMIAELFWTDFLSQEQERFAYWDMGNPDNGFEAYLFYREMQETGAYIEPTNS